MKNEHVGHSGCCGECCQQKSISLTTDEKAFLSKLSQTPFLEVVSFIMKSSKSDHIESVALAPIHLSVENDSMAEIKKTAAILKSLQNYGMIEINYDVPLINYDYSKYKNSDVYLQFIKTVEEAGQKEDFIFDIPHVEYGSLALTGTGQRFV